MIYGDIRRENCEQMRKRKHLFVKGDNFTNMSVPGSVHMFNRRVPLALDWQTWRRQLNHMSVDSVFTVKCVANVFALLKCPSAVH